MKRRCLFTAMYCVISFVSGCAKPDHVTTIQSPTGGVFYTVEITYGHGAIDNDSTSVYAHLERSGKSVKKLVLSGEYLEFSKIDWNDPYDVTLCLQSGFTSLYYNQVTLSVGGDSVTVHNHLQEHCDVPATSK
jgi:hypothetical protein